MGTSSLKKASRLYKSRKFTMVLQLLEPQVFRYRQNFQFYYLLGMSCLQTLDFGGGFSYLQRALDIKPRDVNTLTGLAVVYLKRGDNAEAIQHWFQILDLDPDNKLAKKGLDVLKKYTNQDDLIDYIESGKILSLLPGPGKIHSFMKKIIFSLLLIIVLGSGSYFTYIYLIKYDIKRPEIASVVLNRFGSHTEDKSDTNFTFTDKEILKIFDSIRKYFDSYNDNLAMREINRILLSNADQDTINKVLLLKKYISIPSFTSLKTNFSYQTVMKNPKLYNDCFVHWKGKLSNLQITENNISFDFLVGYEDEKILEGIIPVILNFGARIDTSLPIEVLGQIKNNESGTYIEAISIHQY